MRICWLAFLTFIQFSFTTQAQDIFSPFKRPKLVVGIIVDQMRWDYLYRYWTSYGEGGFKRMLDEGFVFNNVLTNYLPSYTAVGHSAIFTGSVPAFTGITGNDWIEQLSGLHMYCTADSTVLSVGNESEDGKMSPRNLLVSTITDELRIASNFASKIVGISLKDRAAILPAGHTANAAFWLDDASGHFITSSYYMPKLPGWVERFNNSNEIATLIKNGWNTLRPINTYRQSDSDSQPYEGKFPGELTSTFPHQVKEIYQKNKGTFRATPFGNTLTLHFAEASVEGFRLGTTDATDFLTINCASTDYVGHMFGPNSVEIEDTYLRLDQDLADFFRFLDLKVGKGEYALFLTADHGVAHAIDYMKKHRVPGDFWYTRPLLDSLNAVLAEKFKIEKLVRTIMNYQVNFDMAKIFRIQLPFDDIKKMVVEYLQKQPEIAYAVDVAKIGEAPLPEPLKTMITNGYNFKRSGSVQIVLNAGWFEGYSTTGTTHGSWNPYDTHIPLVFVGWGIHHGQSSKAYNMTDIAPTIAALLHIQMPNACIGKAIEEITP